MRSKIAAKIINETPQEVRDEVKKYAKKMRDKNVYEVIEQAEREIQSLHEQLKQVHNKAIDECRHEVALWLTEPGELGSELMERLTAKKTLTAHGEQQYENRMDKR